MRHTKTVFVLVIAALAAGLGYRIFLHTPKEFRQVDVAAYESDMTEALLRGLLRDAGTNGAAAYFLAFGHRLTPPTDVFMGRFSGHLPPVLSYAASRLTPTGEVVDSSSGKVGPQRLAAGDTKDLVVGVSNVAAPWRLRVTYGTDVKGPLLLLAKAEYAISHLRLTGPGFGVMAGSNSCVSVEFSE